MKVLMLNESFNPDGSTSAGLEIMAKTFAEEGVETEIVTVGGKPVADCIACGKCAELKRCVFANDAVNDFAANAIVSFTCAVQVQAFRKIHGNVYSSTMCIGNLRSFAEWGGRALSGGGRGSERNVTLASSRCSHLVLLLVRLPCRSSESGRYGVLASFSWYLSL